MSLLHARADNHVYINSVKPPLSQAVGYVVVVVVGLVIAFGLLLGLGSQCVTNMEPGMVFVTKLLKSTVGEDNEKTEMFMTANRNVRTGLTTSAVISSWLWSTAMLGSSLVGYNYGVSGPFWFAAGCSPMIVFFAVLGIACKLKIPEAHTSLEMVKIRYGTTAHFVYMFLCLLNNLFAVANMLLGASAAISALTGMHIIAATFLLPIGGMLFGIIHICANFGLVIMDTSFFIKAFSASPSAVVPGYIVGGVAYFAIPWALGTVMSSVVLGLENNPIFPTYPRRMSSTEVSNGLVLPYAAIAIAGKGGAAGVLLITFMAVTSTISAQVIAVSSIISFDIYRTYFNKRASDADIIRWSHYGVVFFGLFAAAFSTMLHYVGIDLGWTLYMLGVITCPGIFPTTLTILWRRQSKAAAIISPVLGMATGLAVWLSTAYAFYGAVTVSSTGEVLPCMYGTVAAAFSPLPYTVVITLLKPQRYDWAEFQKQRLAFEVEETATESVAEIERELHPLRDPEGRRKMKYWAKIAAIWAVATFLGHWVLWPLPMYAAKFVFSKKFYTAWLIVAIIWLWATLLIAGFYPLIDGRKQYFAIYRYLSHRLHNRGIQQATPSSTRAHTSFTSTSLDLPTSVKDAAAVDENDDEDADGKKGARVAEQEKERESEREKERQGGGVVVA
ncbi:MAG: hypothetical protein M1819_001690 [Sarea resinae]|nr:MAG: hypothetical protein M1819_001690 [Sarea resinae]